MRYIVLGRPPSLPADFLSCFPSHQRPSFSEIQELTGRSRLHINDDGIVVLVRQPTPQPPDSQRPMGHAACLLNDEPVRICAPLLMRPWVMQACHSRASCHLGTTCTLRMLERFYWRIVTNILHPVMASPLPEVSSTDNLADDGPLADHFEAPA